VAAVLVLAMLGACARRLRRRGMQRLVEGSAAEGVMRAAPWRDAWCASSADLESLRSRTERGGLREAASARRAARSGGGIEATTELGSLYSDTSCTLLPSEGSAAARHLALTRGAACGTTLGMSADVALRGASTGAGWASGALGGAGSGGCAGESSITAERLRRIREQRGGQRLASSRAQLERLRAQTAQMVAAQLDEERGGGDGGGGGGGGGALLSYEGHAEVACEGQSPHPLTPPARGSWRADNDDNGGGTPPKTTEPR